MESRGPWMPGPGLFLLLLLPFPLLSAGSFKHSVLDRRNFRHFDINLKDIYNYFSREWRDLKKGKSKKLYDCNGAFDLYFVLDASSGVGDKWKDICKLVESMVKWYTNPKLRMSFITYSNYGNVLLRLTSDRGDIQAGLKRLKDVITSGPRNMHEGLKKANEEIARVFYSNKKAASLIFTVTAGPLLPTDLRKSKSEADRARNMKAKVYSLGIKDYQRDQLIQIVAGKTQMYEIPQIPDNEGFLISLVGNSCKEVMGGDTFYACVGEPYQLGFFAYGLIQSKIPDYACRYNLDKTEVYTKRPNSVTHEKIICDGHVFEKRGQVVEVDYTLDQGNSFSERKLKVTSKDCVCEIPWNASIRLMEYSQLSRSWRNSAISVNQVSLKARGRDKLENRLQKQC